MNSGDIAPIVRRVAEDVGTEVDDVRIYEDSAAMTTTVKLQKMVNGTPVEVGAAIPDRQMTGQNNVRVVANELEVLVRRLQEEAHEVHELNDHRLVFDTVDHDFHVEDHATGMEWEVEACIHDRFMGVMPNPPEDMPPLVEPELPEGLTQQLKMWVIGWALENDRSKVLNDLSEARYRHNEDHTTERFKYHPAQ